MDEIKTTTLPASNLNRQPLFQTCQRAQLLTASKTKITILFEVPVETDILLNIHKPGRNKVNKVGGLWFCINSTKVFN